MEEEPNDKTKIRNRKQKTTSHTIVPKQKVSKKSNRKSRDISEPSKEVNDAPAPMLSLDINNGNAKTEQVLHTGRAPPSDSRDMRLKNINFYLIIFFILVGSVVVYFYSSK